MFKEVIFILVVVGHVTQGQPVCDMPGMCDDVILDELNNVDTKQECLAACKLDPNCYWVVWLEMMN